jgi:lysyl-tRNA synthetase class II
LFDHATMMQLTEELITVVAETVFGISRIDYGGMAIDLLLPWPARRCFCARLVAAMIWRG